MNEDKIKEIDAQIKKLQDQKKELQKEDEELEQAPFKKRLGPAYDILNNINGFGNHKMTKICSLTKQTKETLIKEFPLLKRLSDEQFAVVITHINVS